MLGQHGNCICDGGIAFRVERRKPVHSCAADCARLSDIDSECKCIIRAKCRPLPVLKRTDHRIDGSLGPREMNQHMHAFKLAQHGPHQEEGYRLRENPRLSKLESEGTEGTLQQRSRVVPRDGPQRQHSWAEQRRHPSPQVVGSCHREAFLRSPRRDGLPPVTAACTWLS